MSGAALSQQGLRRLWALSERGADRAGAALTVFLRRPLRLHVSRVEVVAPPTVSDLMAGLQTNGLAGLRFQIGGEMGGDMLLLLPLSTVFRMLQVLLGRPADPRSLSLEEESALQEVGNILASAFLSELGDVLGRRVLHSTPALQLGQAAELVEPLRRAMADRGEEVLMVQACFADPERVIEGRLFVLPEPFSLRAAVERLAEAEGAQA